MTKYRLFDIKDRVEIRPSTGNENAFNYYYNTGRTGVIPIREIIENWFEIYPKSEKDEMKSRLVSGFHPAFYELAMYNYYFVTI